MRQLSTGWGNSTNPQIFTFHFVGSGLGYVCGRNDGRENQTGDLKWDVHEPGNIRWWLIRGFAV